MMVFATYAQLVESLRDTVSYIADMETREICYMTSKLMELLEVSSQTAYQGKKCFEILHGAKHPCTFCMNKKLAESKRCSWAQYNHRIRKWVLLEDRIADVGGRLYHVETMREAKDDQAWNTQIDRWLPIDNALLQCIQTLSLNRDFDSAASSFLEMVGQFYAAGRAYIIEFDAENQILSNTFEWCAQGVTPQQDYLQKVPLSVVDDWVVKFQAAGEFYISSINTDLDPESIDYQMLREQDIDSLMAVPLYSDGEIVGFVGVDDPRLNVNDMRLLRAAADFLVIEMQNRRMLRRLQHLSDYDILTGLYNRNKYVIDLNARYRDVPQQLGIILCNINGMKGLNNTYGQAYGDQIVIKVAKLLRETVPCDVYRIGGDEFFAPCPEMDLEAFEQLEEKLRAVFERHTECSVSIGTSWAGAGIDINEQILRADERLRAEKQAYYQAALAAGQQIDDSVTQQLLSEIQAGAFIVYYQPQIELSSGKIVGAEALVRKRDKDGTLIPPGQFIPYYEAQGVMMHLDFHVLELVLQDQKKLLEKGRTLPISVNFTRTTLLMQNFVQRVLALCEKYGVATSGITLEVTESVATIDHERLQELLQAIRQAGLRLSLDDFGSKYSNMAILAEIPFDEVKFDKMLVDSLSSNQRSRTILKELVGMCSRLGDTIVVVEGIERREQAELLREYGCRVGQGYYYYKPIPLDQLEATLPGEKEQRGAER